MWQSSSVFLSMALIVSLSQDDTVGNCWINFMVFSGRSN